MRRAWSDSEREVLRGLRRDIREVAKGAPRVGKVLSPAELERLEKEGAEPVLADRFGRALFRKALAVEARDLRLLLLGDGKNAPRGLIVRPASSLGDLGPPA